MFFYSNFYFSFVTGKKVLITIAESPKVCNKSVKLHLLYIYTYIYIEVYS